MKQPKSFSAACKQLGIKTHQEAYDKLKLDNDLGGKTPIEKSKDPHLKLMIINLAVNDGKLLTPDEDWYRIWWWREQDAKNPTGFRLACDDFVHTGTGATVSSRLCFREAKGAQWAGRQKFYIELCEQYMLVKK